MIDDGATTATSSTNGTAAAVDSSSTTLTTTTAHSPQQLRQRQLQRQWSSPRRIPGSVTASPGRLGDARKKEQHQQQKKLGSPRAQMKLAAGVTGGAGASGGSEEKADDQEVPSPTRKPRNGAGTNDRTNTASSRREFGVALKAKTGDNARPEKKMEARSGREGRKFAVANVGNHGRIYLRPSVRAAAERYAQPPLTLPITPPSTASLDLLASRADDALRQSHMSGSSMHTPVTPGWPTSDMYDAPPRIRHKRAYSYSTVDEQHAFNNMEEGTFRIVIERPASPRPQSADGLKRIPTLEVPIPSYKLGTPRWDTQGTPFLRSASHTTVSEDLRSSFLTATPQELPAKDINASPSDVGLPGRHSHTAPQPYLRLSQSLIDLSKLPQQKPLPTRVMIEPAMFDALTFKPSCDDRAVVRYAAATGTITAATPPRLVAEITSPTFLDYDLLSDFFLTFRSFLSTSDLLAMLFARLRWALDRDDEAGMVVRVRTFVALRHWILNYFMDDFVVDYELRQSFCDSLNTFVADIMQRPAVGVNKLKILTELKKCWRRTCALYWDGPDFATDVGYNSPIVPGGVAGSRDPKLDPSFYDGVAERAEAPQLNDVLDFHHASGDYNFFAEASQAPPPEGYLRFQRQDTSELPESRSPRSPIRSMMSEDFVSCSFPRAIRIGGHHHHANTTSAAQAVAPRPIYESDNAAPTGSSKAYGKRRAGPQGHKRSGSFSDSLRDDRMQTPVQKVIYKNTELLMTLPFAGSLVRGNLFPPGQAFVEAIAPGTPADPNRSMSVLRPIANDKGASAMSGPGMKKLLGSVRRALSTRTPHSEGHGVSHGHGPRASSNRLPGTAYVPHGTTAGARGLMRIDLLGAGIAEDFKKAVQEEAEEAGETEGGRGEDPERYSFTRQPARDSIPILGIDRHASHSTPLRLNPPHQRNQSYPRPSMSDITYGSQSIVIVDDTLQFDLPQRPMPHVSTMEVRPSLDVPPSSVMLRPSMDNFLDSMLQRSGDPTPPNTPPEQAGETSRRSSHFLPDFGRPRSISLDRPPSLIMDLQSTSSEMDDYNSPPRVPKSPPLRSYGRNHPPVSLRRYASIRSSYRGHGTERSFDATTVSDGAERFLNDASDAPAPLRVLRRRPGGDLRANNNVGDLVHIIRRPRSTGSLTTYSDSIASSYLQSRGSNAYPVLRNSIVRTSGYSQSIEHARNFSLGALAEHSPQKEGSVHSGRSSHHPLRPSFEAEAQKLAQIPDDDDDGGVESALLKLEGKFESKKAERKSLPLLEGGPNSSFGLPPQKDSDDHQQDTSKKANRHKQVMENGNSTTAVAPLTYRPKGMPVDLDQGSPAVYQPRGFPPPHEQPANTESIASYSSIPLLERDRKNDSQERNVTYGHPTPESSHPSMNFLGDASSIANGEVEILDLENDSDVAEDDVDDISSEISIDALSGDGGPTDFTRSTIRVGIDDGASDVPVHPLRHPPSPYDADTADATKQLTLPHEPTAQHRIYKPLPPTPDITPTSDANFEKDEEKPTVKPDRITSSHLPFILAFDSEVLAQQFTLIEKDALNEIDWKELIEMRWKNTSSCNPRSWVEFLKCREPRGVEVVIARFNIMVKWAMSECVLTSDLEERVRCIVKCIHIAAHCRRIRNYATMYQLTVALTSNEISRLSRTWQRVPASDLRTLQELEMLVQPTRNFYNLRAEMEGAGTDRGCIPFVGIYTHDLLFNAQRPSQIASTPTTEPLVNFERCRTTAAIVKNLLRLLEASSRYTFQPIEGITERCLWMAALSDDDIRRHAESLE